MGNISWLLIALVSLDIKLLPREDPGIFFLALLCVLLFFYNITARYGMFRKVHGPLKTFIDLITFLIFIVLASWFTGKITSPFISLLYLVLMATSLTQGRRVTYLMSVLAVCSDILLSSDDFYAFLTARSDQLSLILGYLLELFPFMLIAHLGAMLSGETENARVRWNGCRAPTTSPDSTTCGTSFFWRISRKRWPAGTRKNSPSACWTRITSRKPMNVSAISPGRR